MKREIENLLHLFQCDFGFYGLFFPILFRFLCAFLRFFFSFHFILFSYSRNWVYVAESVYIYIYTRDVIRVLQFCVYVFVRFYWYFPTHFRNRRQFVRYKQLRDTHMSDTRQYKTMS